MAGALRKFFTNVICGLVYNKDARKKMRVVLNSDMLGYIRFIQKHTGLRLRKIKTFIGYRARNLLISVNDKYIFKFPLRRADSNELAIREKRIVDALAPLSPIYIPPVTVLKYGDKLVRQYDFIQGAQLRKLSVDFVLKNMDAFVKPVARMLYEIACADPAEIRDLKPTPDAMPGYLYGWCQGDIADNFLINPETMEIVAFIDWEDCAFGDFSDLFIGDKRTPMREFMTALKQEYDRLYNNGGK